MAETKSIYVFSSVYLTGSSSKSRKTVFVYTDLFKVIYTGREDRLEFIAVNIFKDIIGTEPFRMGHLAENAAIGAGNAFDSQDRLVRVVFAVIGSLAGKVDVLRRNLTFGCQFTNLFRRRNKAAFTVRNSNGMDVTGLAAAEPGAHDRNDFRVDHAGQVAADGVIGQGRAVGLQRLNLAIGQEAEFNQGLEAIADAEG